MRLRSLLLAPLLLAGCLAGCGPDPGLRIVRGTDWHAYTQDPKGHRAGSDLSSIRFRPELCNGEDLRPDYSPLNEQHLITFLARQRIDSRIERPRADLTYLVLQGMGTARPVWLRVAILPNADEAGRELHQAMLQHGPGSWGVHRSNLAVLGPIGDYGDDLAFAASTKLACWGVFSVTGTDDVFVVPGGYTEI